MKIGFHKGISFIKSGIRIIACIPVLFWQTPMTIIILAAGLLLAEILGIIEEIYEDN